MSSWELSDRMAGRLRPRHRRCIVELAKPCHQCRETWRDWRKLPQHDPQAIADLSANGIGLLFVDPDSRMIPRHDLSRGFCLDNER